MPRYDEHNGNTRLYVGRLSYRTSSHELESLFNQYGRVRDVDMKHDYYAFVDFNDPRDADDARYHLDGREFYGFRITVQFSRGVPRGPGGVREYVGRGPPLVSGRCFNCGLEGHWAHDCKDGDRKNKCYRCGDKGHIEKYCQNSPKSISKHSYSRSPFPRRGRRSPSYSRSYSRSRSPRRNGRSRNRPPPSKGRKRSPSPNDNRSPRNSPPPSNGRKHSPSPNDSRSSRNSPPPSNGRKCSPSPNDSRSPRNSPPPSNGQKCSPSPNGSMCPRERASPLRGEIARNGSDYGESPRRENSRSPRRKNSRSPTSQEKDSLPERKKLSPATNGRNHSS